MSDSWVLRMDLAAERVRTWMDGLRVAGAQRAGTPWRGRSRMVAWVSWSLVGKNALSYAEPTSRHTRIVHER